MERVKEERAKVRVKSGGGGGGWGELGEWGKADTEIGGKVKRVGGIGVVNDLLVMGKDNGEDTFTEMSQRNDKGGLQVFAITRGYCLGF